MGKKFDSTLMDVQQVEKVPGLDNIAVEVYSYNSKPPRIRVVQELRTGYAIILRGMELKDTDAIVKVLVKVLKNTKPKVAGRKIKARRNATRDIPNVEA